MSDRHVRYALRALVIVALASLVIAMWGARLTLAGDPTASSLFYAYLVYLPVVAAPGWIVWREPRARWLAVWAGVGWVATIVHQVVAVWPYYHGVDPFGHALAIVETPVAVAWTAILFVAPILAVGISTPRDRVTATARRIRRVCQLAAGFALGAIGVANLGSRGEHAEAALLIGAYVLWLLLPAVRCYHRPSRGAVLVWWLWTVVFTGLGGILTMHTDGMELTGRLVFGCLSALAALVLVVMPIVTLAFSSDDDDDDAGVPTARVHSPRPASPPIQHVDYS